jgi:Xaa-Pro aminopeptidase
LILPEPGIYRHPAGGLRLEDNILITQIGCENLNSSRRWWSSDEVSGV